MKTIRIFISSPGDVIDERERSKLVVEELRRSYVGQLDLRVLLWEDLPLEASLSFQEGIDLVLADHGVDIAVFILWSRLGTPLGASIRKPDDTEYRSGTEREWDLMVRARMKSSDGRPQIFVYVRQDEASFEERLRGTSTEEKRSLIDQKALVEQFISGEFHDANAANIRAYHNFDRTAKFTQRLRVHLKELLDQLAGHAGPQMPWNLEREGPPFVGLDSFGIRHTPVFFGREDEMVALRKPLRDQAQRGCAFVLIAGASGSGKTSIAQAGLLPAVAANEIDSDLSGWRMAMFTPSGADGDALETLSRALMSATALPGLNRGLTAAADLAKDLLRDPEMVCRHVLRPALQHHFPGHRLIVLVDQLEEIFVDQRIASSTQQTFCCALEALARSGCIWVVATIRSDFYEQAQRVGSLVQMMEGGGRFDLLPPDADALDRLIRKRAALAGLRFEQRGDTTLADVILRDAIAHRELLPLLEYLLNRLCAERTPEGVLTYASYESLGGVEGALARRAEAVIAEFKPTESALDALLSALATVRGDDRDTIVRRRLARAELERDEVSRRLVQALVDERLLTSSSLPGSPPMVSVAHEALFRVWPSAVAWLRRNREFVRLRAKVAQAFARWQESGKHPSLLLPAGLPLDEATSLMAIETGRLEAPLRDYVGSSVKRAEAEAADDRARELALSERNSYLEQVHKVVRSTMSNALLLQLVERKVIARKRNPIYSDFLKVSADREQAYMEVATINALLTGTGRWHPRAAEAKHSFGATGDYAEGWIFPCCGQTAITSDDPPIQISDNGCSRIPITASPAFRLSSTHMDVLRREIDLRLSRGVELTDEVRYLHELLELIRSNFANEQMVPELLATGDEIAARLSALVPVSNEQDQTRFHMWRTEAICVYETIGAWASFRRQWTAAKSAYTSALEVATSVMNSGDAPEFDVERTRGNLARLREQMRIRRGVGTEDGGRE